MFDDDLLATEAAALLGCSPARLRQIADAGGIACERHGRHKVRSFKRADVEALRASRAAAGKTRRAGDPEASK